MMSYLLSFDHEFLFSDDCHTLYDMYDFPTPHHPTTHHSTTHTTHPHTAPPHTHIRECPVCQLQRKPVQTRGRAACPHSTRMATASEKQHPHHHTRTRRDETRRPLPPPLGKRFCHPHTPGEEPRTTPPPQTARSPRIAEPTPPTTVPPPPDGHPSQVH